jgi:hypothetical protein
MGHAMKKNGCEDRGGTRSGNSAIEFSGSPIRSRRTPTNLGLILEHITILAEVRITGPKPSTKEVYYVQIIFYNSGFRRSDGF